MILVDPETREPLPAIAGEKPRAPSRANHWEMVRENGVVVRMVWHFCDDPKCCPPGPVTR